MPFFQRDHHTSIFYEITGQGSPLLLIHGFMGTGATEFPELRQWLANRYQVIAPDLRGYGQSTPKPREYGRDFYRQDAEDLAALLEHLNLPSAAVMGYSDGGEVALWLPILAPERVRCVVAWGATGHFDDRIRPAVLANLSMNWRTPALDALHGAAHVPIMAQKWVHSMLAIIDAGGDVTYSRAAEIRCPVLVILGDRDPLNPADLGESMAKAIPNGRFRRFRRTGHAVHRERPRLFRWVVGQFLSKYRQSIE